MFSYNIINPPKSFVLKNKIIESILNEIENSEQTQQYGVLNIVFVCNKEIQKLNKDYRKIDQITDVLSFHYFDDFSKLNSKEVAGEIILSEEKIISQGKNYKLGSELECYKLIIHSVLHILGYDHEDDKDYLVMNEKEEKIWSSVLL